MTEIEAAEELLRGQEIQCPDCVSGVRYVGDTTSANGHYTPYACTTCNVSGKLVNRRYFEALAWLKEHGRIDCSGGDPQGGAGSV